MASLAPLALLLALAPPGYALVKLARGSHGGVRDLGPALAALVSQELDRASPVALESPLFAGLPLRYSFFPALAARLLRLPTDTSLFDAFMVSLPAAGLMLTALTVDGLVVAQRARLGRSASRRGAREPGRGPLLFLLPPAHVGGLKPLLVAALAQRRVAAVGWDFGIDPEAGRIRRAHVESLYTTTRSEEAENALCALGVRWVWTSTAHPLSFNSERLILAFETSTTHLYKLRYPTSSGRMDDGPYS